MPTVVKSCCISAQKYNLNALTVLPTLQSGWNKCVREKRAGANIPGSEQI